MASLSARTPGAAARPGELDCFAMHAKLFNEAAALTQRVAGDRICVLLSLGGPAADGHCKPAWKAPAKLLYLPLNFTAGDVLAVACALGHGSFQAQSLLRPASSDYTAQHLAGDTQVVELTQTLRQVREKVLQHRRGLGRLEAEQGADGTLIGGADLGTDERPLQLWVVPRSHGKGLLQDACGHMEPNFRFNPAESGPHPQAPPSTGATPGRDHSPRAGTSKQATAAAAVSPRRGTRLGEAAHARGLKRPLEQQPAPEEGEHGEEEPEEEQENVEEVFAQHYAEEEGEELMVVGEAIPAPLEPAGPSKAITSPGRRKAGGPPVSFKPAQPPLRHCVGTLLDMPLPIKEVKGKKPRKPAGAHSDDSGAPTASGASHGRAAVSDHPTSGRLARPQLGARDDTEDGIEDSSLEMETAADGHAQVQPGMHLRKRIAVQGLLGTPPKKVERKEAAGQGRTHRQRLRWSEEEAHALLDGLLELPEEDREKAWSWVKANKPAILARRNNIDLKDKWRTLQTQWERMELEKTLADKVARLKVKLEYNAPWPFDRQW